MKACLMVNSRPLFNKWSNILGIGYLAYLSRRNSTSLSHQLKTFHPNPPSLVMWWSTPRLGSLYKKSKHLTLKRCIGAWFVLPKARDRWRPKLHSPENHGTASVSASRSKPQRSFLYIITHYNAFALFSFYPNLYIKVK